MTYVDEEYNEAGIKTFSRYRRPRLAKEAIACTAIRRGVALVIYSNPKSGENIWGKAESEK